MRALLQQIAIGVRLNFRNRMALVYGYAFPTIFLIAFRVLYRGESVPLLLHMGELLTVTILGSACFGLPTGIVNDRERGVWRRYRMLPMSSFAVLGGTLVTRYLLLLSAGLLQLVLAMAAGLPAPHHLFALWAAFSAGAVSFIAIGLVIAMLAPTVPAVQALGQCVFLPMLIIGGVAVPLSSLPDWAQRVSSFLPGRYSVEAIQIAMTRGIEATPRFDLIALAVIGVTGAVAGVLAFRWDTTQPASPWVAIAMTGWLIVGVASQPRGQIRNETIPRQEQPPSTDFAPSPVPQPTHPEPAAPKTWKDITKRDIDGVAFERLPKDDGVIGPIAAPGEVPDATTAEQLDQIYAVLPEWKPGQAKDPVQRVRNLLYVAAIADIYRLDPMERFIPYAVFDQIQRAVPSDDLQKILYFIATHPEGGNDSAANEMREMGLPAGPRDTRTLRNRAMIYAFKFLSRLVKTDK